MCTSFCTPSTWAFNISNDFLTASLWNINVEPCGLSSDSDSMSKTTLVNKIALSCKMQRSNLHKTGLPRCLCCQTVSYYLCLILCTSIDIQSIISICIILHWHLAAKGLHRTVEQKGQLDCHARIPTLECQCKAISEFGYVIVGFAWNHLGQSTPQVGEMIWNVMGVHLVFGWPTITLHLNKT